MLFLQFIQIEAKKNGLKIYKHKLKQIKMLIINLLILLKSY